MLLLSPPFTSEKPQRISSGSGVSWESTNALGRNATRCRIAVDVSLNEDISKLPSNGLLISSRLVSLLVEHHIPVEQNHVRYFKTR